LPAGLHAVPAVHATHWPPLQTILAPQEVPSAVLPVRLQAGMPDEHDVTPAWHVLPFGLHGWLGAQAPHWPAVLQTPASHAVPGVAWPVCVQTTEPVVHETDPVRHTLPPGLQAAPVAHALQAPALQTMFGPQDVPFGTVPVEAQAWAPVAHDVVPVEQGLAVGVHESPELHATHAPLLQTMFCPHAVPSAAF
jgi:hypothetical protein